ARRPGLRIDLDFAGVAAVWEVTGAGAVGRSLIEAGLHAGRQLLQLEGRLRHFVDAEALVGAGDGEAAILEFHVVFGGSEEVRRALFALGEIFSLTMTMAPPLMVVEREPPVPIPKATASVSPWMNFTCSGSTPSRSTRICVCTVAWPWPCEMEPVTNVIPPSGSKRMSAVSMVGSAAISWVLEMRMPRSIPCLAASLRRASKPFQSASFMVRSRFSSNRPLS